MTVGPRHREPDAPTFEENLAAIIGLRSVPAIRTVCVKSESVTITRTVGENASAGLTEKLPCQKSFILSIPIKDFIGHELWKQDVLYTKEDYPSGAISMLHLEEEPQAVLPSAFDVVQIVFPELSLRELSDNGEVPNFDLLWKHACLVDPIIGSLGLILADIVDRGQGREQLFLDHIVMAIHSRLVSEYSTSTRARSLTRRLTLAQERKAKELLTADLSRDPPIEAIAREIGIPANRFGSAFKATLGLPPYRWLRQIRIDTAKRLLRGRDMSLAEIAYECGFSDQSHFTRVFGAHTAMSPGQWRRDS